MANSNPWCASTCTDIYFEVTEVNSYGNATVEVLEFSCATGGVQGGGTSGIEVLPVPGVAFRVGVQGWAKLMQSAVDGDCYWRAYSLSDAKPLTIRFEIVEPLTVSWDPCSVLVHILSRPFGMPVVPEEYGGTLFVRDMVGCFLKGIAEDLVGLGGYASYMDADDIEIDEEGNAHGDYRPPGMGACPGTPTPRWEITSLCCRQDRCDL